MCRFKSNLVAVLALGAVLSGAAAARSEDKRYPLFAYLTGSPAPSLVAYTPSQLDPRQEGNQRKLPTSSIRADLAALRPHFDGLVLYGYHEASTPRVVAVAKDLKFKAILLAVWDPRSAAELDGVAELARLYEKDMALGVIVGNEGLTFKRYEQEDLTIAAARLRARLPKTVPLTTSEPLVGYEQPFVREFGDFLCPNIHPVFDREKLAPKEAAAWAREQALALAMKVKKPVVLKETGFPHAGKPAYTPETQKAYWAAYIEPGVLVTPPNETGVWVSYAVAFEAFDLPWKAVESGLPIEASWGLLSPKREPYPVLSLWKAMR